MKAKKITPPKLRVLGIENTKTLKGLSTENVLTAILYLSPATEAADEIAAIVGYRPNLCPKASPGCAFACLYTSGLAGVFPTVNAGRLRKTVRFWTDREAFLADLDRDIQVFLRFCEKHGFTPAVRLNGTSDLLWEGIRHDGQTFPARYPDLQFYDYTKIPRRAGLPNYDLTFSRSETNDDDCRAELSRGRRVAVVFADVAPMPTEWFGVPVVNGDEDDVRFRDPGSVVVGLLAKGDARYDRSGFVVTSHLDSKQLSRWEARIARREARLEAAA